MAKLPKERIDPKAFTVCGNCLGIVAPVPGNSLLNRDGNLAPYTKDPIYICQRCIDEGVPFMPTLQKIRHRDPMVWAIAMAQLKEFCGNANSA